MVVVVPVVLVVIVVVILAVTLTLANETVPFYMHKHTEVGKTNACMIKTMLGTLICDPYI